MPGDNKTNKKKGKMSDKPNLLLDNTHENQFCVLCNNLLQTTEGETLKLICLSCGQTYDTAPDDTMIYEEIKGVNLMIYSKIIRKIKYDPASPKAFVKCKCGHNVVRQARLGDQLKLINACLNCDNVWIVN